MIPNEILNYTVIRLIGSGGMGQVFLARNKNIDQYVAIKSLHPRYANNEALRQRFKQEAQMLSSLNHPNIVKFLNYVENEHGVFLIMEYVDGMTLEDFIRNKNGLIVEKRAYPMMCEILDAFSYAHSRGIVHRDIKPSNIFITKEGNIKVMDFGIAQILSDVSGQAAGGNDGTPEYMSPEQVQGNPVDKRSDIYSLGVLFHHMLTGRTPYNSTTMSKLEIMQCVVDNPLPRLKEFYPYTSDGMQKVVDKAVSKEPDERYQDCDEMKKSIKNVIDPEKRSRLPLYIGIALAVLVIAGGLLFWDYNRTKIRYYKDYAEYYGVPEGIGKLSTSEMEQRSSSYKMEFSKGKLRRVTLVNSKGKPVKHGDTEFMNLRYTDVEYFYTDGGKIDYKKIYDEYGKPLYKLDYDEKLKTASLKYDDEYGTAAHLKANTTNNYSGQGELIPETSRITRYLLDFDDETGLLKEMHYAAGENNDRIGDADNIYGFKYDYDDEGRIVKITFLGQDDKIRGNKFGLAYKTYAYDDDDNWTNVSYFAADGSPSHDGNNCSVVDIEYDKYGNRIAEHYRTSDGEPALRTDTGCFGFVYEYEDGNRTVQSSIDGDGNLMANYYGYATAKMKYDDNGYMINAKFYDTNGEPTNNIENGEAYGEIRTKVNDRGLQTEFSYFNIAGEPIELSSGIHRYEYEYDEAGNMTRATFYDSNDKPAKENGFHSSLRRTYDDFNRLTSETFYDDKDSLVQAMSGIAKVVITYDRQGNIARMEDYGTDGTTRVSNNHGVSAYVYKYDEIGNNILLECLDEKDKPVVESGGDYKVEYVYDPETNFVTEIKHYDINKLKWTLHRAYDSNGNIIKDYSTNADGSLRSGTAVENTEYDSNNRAVKIWYTDLKGNKVNKPSCKYSQQTFKYDSRGNVIEITYLDKDGKPATDTDGTHKRIHEFDSANRVIYEKNLDAAGKPINGNNSSPEGRVTYDERGNTLTITCYDGYGKPSIGADGYHRFKRTYDNRNNMLTGEYVDTDGKLVNHKSLGYAKVVNTYDDKGNLTSAKYYSKDDKVSYEEKYTYNNRNQLTSVMYLNSAGKQSDEKYGYSKITIEYQDNGVIPSVQKVYTTNGTMLGSRKFNTRTNEWGDWNITGSAPSMPSTSTYSATGSSSSSSDWRSSYMELAAECPMQVTSEITVYKVKFTGSGVEIYIRLNMSQSEIEEERSTLRSTMMELRRALRKESGMPSSAELDILVYDRKGVFVFLV